MSIGRPSAHSSAESTGQSGCRAHPAEQRKVPRRQPHQTNKLSPIHRRIASAHVRVRQCTGFAGICRSNFRISDRREGAVSGKFDQGMVDATALIWTYSTVWCLNRRQLAHRLLSPLQRRGNDFSNAGRLPVWVDSSNPSRRTSSTAARVAHAGEVAACRFSEANRSGSRWRLARQRHHGDVVLLAELLSMGSNLLGGLRTDGRGSVETKEFRHSCHGPRSRHR